MSVRAGAASRRSERTPVLANDRCLTAAAPAQSIIEWNCETIVVTADEIIVCGLVKRFSASGALKWLSVSKVEPLNGTQNDTCAARCLLFLHDEVCLV